jgi:hypothetical protein
MEDNKEKESSGNRANNELKDTPPIVPTAGSETITKNQATANMEVHHHSHAHGKRNWKSYIWEFIMLFLAVFCGFLAEYQLEHTIEHNREKEFVKSMIEDARLDTANVRKVIRQKRMQKLYADSLIAVLYSYEPGKVSDYEIYRYYRHMISATEWVKPTERTLLQLKNSGGMRLIRNSTAADIIIAYDGFGKDVLEQQAFLDPVFLEIWKPACDLFNFKYYNPGSYQGISDSAALLHHDKTKFIQFANMLTAFGGGLAIYCVELEEMREQAAKLTAVLSKEYHLEDN